MKRFLATLVFTISVIIASAQLTYISTEGAYIETISSGVVTDSKPGYVSLIIFNDDITMLKHKINGMMSTYYITSRELKEFGGNKCLCLEVISDVGNRYTMVVDKYNGHFFTFNLKDDYCIVYTIKSIWSE